MNVGGNLYIAGSGFELTTSTLSVSSPIIYINNSLSGAGNVFDIGLVGHFKTNIYQHTGLVRSAQNNYWTLFSGLTTEPLSGPNLHYSDPTFTIDTLRANILGNLSGNNISANTASFANSTATIDASGNLHANSASFTNIYNPFNQSLNTNDDVQFPHVTVDLGMNVTNGGINSGNIHIGFAGQNPVTVLDADGTSSFASGAVTIDATGNLNSSASAKFQSVSAISLSGVFFGDGSHLIGASLPGQSTINTIVTSTSANWDNVYSTVNSNSATTWNYQGTDLKALSGNWQSGYSTLSSLSGNLQSGYSTLSSLSGNLQSGYSTLSSLSGNFKSGYSTLSSLSGNWQSSYATVSSLSSNWNSLATIYLQFSANALSANYIYGSMNETVFTDGSSLIGNGNDTLTLNYLSGVYINSLLNYKGYTGDNWNNTYTIFSGQSANNISVYSTVSSNSATTWNYQGTDLKALSANWDNTYLNVSANSATWTAGGNSVALQGLSANWQSVYTTVTSYSGNWQSGYNTLSSLSGNWQSSYGTVSSLSGNWQNVYSQYTKMSAASTLSATYIYGNGIETVFTDGSSLSGNGNGSLTMNYASGVYVNTNLYLSSAKLPSKIYLYDPSGVRWQLSVTTTGTLSTVKA